jgi:hypothetical protein
VRGSHESIKEDEEETFSPHKLSRFLQTNDCKALHAAHFTTKK